MHSDIPSQSVFNKLEVRSLVGESTVERANRDVQCLGKILYGYRLRDILFKILARLGHDGSVMKCAECLNRPGNRGGWLV